MFKGTSKKMFKGTSKKPYKMKDIILLSQNGYHGSEAISYMSLEQNQTIAKEKI